MPTDTIGIKARKEHFQTLLAQQKFEERAKRLIPIHEVERAWSMIVVAVRSKLLALPQTLSDKLYREATLHGLEGVERALRTPLEPPSLQPDAGEGEAAAAENAGQDPRSEDQRVKAR